MVHDCMITGLCEDLWIMIMINLKWKIRQQAFAQQEEWTA